MPEEYSATLKRLKDHQGKELIMINVGRIVVTPRAQKAMDDVGMLTDEIVRRHKYSDDDDWSENTLPESPDQLGERVMSLLPLAGGTNILVITDADRKKTTLMVDDEY